MPHRTGFETMAELQAVSPHIRHFVLIGYLDDKLFATIKVSAMGYLLKETNTVNLRAAIRYVHQRLALLLPMVARRVIRELNHSTGLSPAQEPLGMRFGNKSCILSHDANICAGTCARNL